MTMTPQAYVLSCVIFSLIGYFVGCAVTYRLCRKYPLGHKP